MRGYDAWVTREPPYMDDGPMPSLKCSGCGCFLAETPDGIREWFTVRHCTGQAKIITCTYDAHDDAAILRIIGDEFAGKTYEVAYPPECGGSEPQRMIHNDGDIDPKNAASYRHDPHWFEDPMGPSAAGIRICRHCGHHNEEATW